MVIRLYEQTSPSCEIKNCYIKAAYSKGSEMLLPLRVLELEDMLQNITGVCMCMEYVLLVDSTTHAF